ncbi:hypothetical protein B0T17DRAFT_620351 [Bombardia bombarda]|uniref:Uncharacterized protein n=1 Tax=Bombardia bombarda TaxID=252184 RepID=A0AA39TQ56_9PEZI|nr:hypothetical protein B0T17DRAFT_620351 [Bombardia bombarda]
MSRSLPVSPLTARQSRKRTFEDDPESPGPPHDDRPVNRTKTDHYHHHDVERYLLSLPLSYDSDLAKDHNTATVPAFPDTFTPLSRKALREFERNMSPNRLNNPHRHATPEDTGATPTYSSRVNAYSDSFPQVLRDNDIRLDGSRAELADLEELLRERDVRPSLTPSQCSDEEIEKIFQANATAATETDVERKVVSAIVGWSPFPNSSNVSWSNMSSMTGGETAPPQPDLYYGTHVSNILKSIRERVGQLIIPSINPHAPALPHLVLENEGPGGDFEVAKRQAGYSGAVAARSALALENIGQDVPTYDNKAMVHAWTYTSSPGLLTHYVVRVTPPSQALHSQDTTQQYRVGVSAFRDCRDESHAKSQARLDRAHERERQLNEQASHRDTTLGPAETEIPVPAPPLAESQQEDVEDGYLDPPYHSSQPPPHIPALGTAIPTHEFDLMLEEQLQENCQASFPQEGSISQKIRTNVAVSTFAQTHETPAQEIWLVRVSSDGLVETD